ncbi:MAG: saccharopine dehydrogenase C-terminal domain-containing protein [Rhodothermales bacterium]
MKITVIGAGEIGSAVAEQLSRYEEIQLVQVCDAGARALQDLHDRVQNPKLRSFQIDARDQRLVEPIIQGSDCVVNCLPASVRDVIAEICLSMGLHYCDLGGDDTSLDKILALNDAAAEKGVWIVPNCGLAPGFTNVLCLHAISRFDSVEAAFIRVGVVPQHPKPPFNFRLSWSAEKVISDYTRPAKRIIDGEIVTVEPLTDVEPIHFPEPYGELEAFSTAGGMATLTEQLLGRVHTLDHKTIRWPGHANQMRFLLGLGLGEDRSIDVRTHLTYRDVLVRRMRKRLGGHFADAALLRIVVHGTRDGEQKSLVYELIDTTGDDRTMAIRRVISIPTAAMVHLVATGKTEGQGGACPPEQVVTGRDMVDLVRAQGLDLQKTYYDGFIDVDQPPVLAAS